MHFSKKKMVYVLFVKYGFPDWRTIITRKNKFKNYSGISINMNVHMGAGVTESVSASNKKMDKSKFEQSIVSFFMQN
jgi:hypothetical protein